MASISSGGTPQTADAAQTYQTQADRYGAQGIQENAKTAEDSIATDVALNAANSAAKKPGKVQVP